MGISENGSAQSSKKTSAVTWWWTVLCCLSVGVFKCLKTMWFHISVPDATGHVLNVNLTESVSVSLAPSLIPCIPAEVTSSLFLGLASAPWLHYVQPGVSALGTHLINNSVLHWSSPRDLSSGNTCLCNSCLVVTLTLSFVTYCLMFCLFQCRILSPSLWNYVSCFMTFCHLLCGHLPLRDIPSTALWQFSSCFCGVPFFGNSDWILVLWDFSCIVTFHFLHCIISHHALWHFRYRVVTFGLSPTLWDCVYNFVLIQSLQLCDIVLSYLHYDIYSLV